MMGNENVAMLARARQNHLAEYLRAHDNVIQGGSVKNAYITLRTARQLEIERRDHEDEDAYFDNDSDDDSE